ncbi:MAG: ABC transporter ATP-binding protein [Chloroflexi bacterium]|nr:ABC transporter ATP-binding protein [Chloroflexota bacterium]
MSSGSPAALRIDKLQKSFGALRVLADISFDIEAGERRVLLGPNGAGKTTLFNVISGLLAPDDGTIVLMGQDITKQPAHRRAALGLARTFQITALFPQLTLRQNIVLAVEGLSRTKFSMLRPLTAHHSLLTRADALLEEWSMRDRRDVPVKELSYGDQRQVEIVMAIAHQPKVLLLDEPTAGLSRVETARVVEFVRALPRQISMLIIEHDMDVAFELADTLSVLHMGTVVVTGDPQVVRANPRVREIYLGEMAETLAR